MLREEAIAYGKRVINLGLTDETLEFCELAIKALQQESCEDAVSRQAVLEVLKDKWSMFSDANDAMQESIDTIEALSNVTPQEPRKGYLSINDVMSVFDDFMCGEVDEEGTETFWEMLKDKAEIEL